MKLSSILSKNKDFNQVFLGQNPDEKIVGITRRGFVIELPWFIPSILGFYFIVLDYRLLDTLVGNLFTDSYLLFIRLLLFIVLSNFFINRITDWFYSVNLVTTQRILDFEFSGLGIKKIVETDLRNIQSVTIESSGFLSFIFGLSTIHILTSGDNPNIDLEYISNANEIQNFISDLARKSRS